MQLALDQNATVISGESNRVSVLKLILHIAIYFSVRQAESGDKSRAAGGGKDVYGNIRMNINKKFNELL